MNKLINVGSLCIDYVYAVPSIVGEGQTLASSSRDVFAGGKGLNQSLAAAKAGCQVHHFGAVGDDGQMLIETLQAAGVDCDHVLRMNAASGHAMIQVDSGGQNAIVIDGGTNRGLPHSLFDQAVALAEEGDWLLLQNETNDIAYVIESAASSKAKVAINIAPPDERILDYPLELVDLLVVNIAEACALAQVSDLEDAFAVLAARFADTNIVLTQGGDGLWVKHGARRLEAGAYEVLPVDETAAGDSFVGYLLAGLVAGAGIDTALVEASAAGALATTNAGAAPSIPTRESVQQLVASQPLDVRAT